MTIWTRRPIEIASLFNPAFCAIILRETIKGYVMSSGNSIPYPLIFLPLPIILHEQTRLSLPRSISTKFHAWITNNPELRIEFSERVQRLIPYTKEGIIFALQRDIILFDEQAHINYRNDRMKSPNWQIGSEPDQCIKKAAFLGRWFAEAGDPLTIFTLWGIRP